MEQPLQPTGQAQNTPVKKAWYKKWWVITIAVIAVLYSIGNSAVEDTKERVAEEKTQPTETKMAEPEKMVPAIMLTSANLATEYSENEVAADAKYKGKLLEVSGKVASIDNGISDNEMIVKLSDGKFDISGPWCYMKESERDKVLAFKKDQQVTLIGTGNSATIGSPMVKDCVVK